MNFSVAAMTIPRKWIRLRPGEVTGEVPPFLFHPDSESRWGVNIALAGYPLLGPRRAQCNLIKPEWGVNV